MKKSDIMIGLCYTNGKGRVRKVLDRTQDGKYKLYDHQTETDCVLYEIVKDGSKKNFSAGKSGVMTTTSFATWAKHEVNNEEAEGF